MATKLSKFQKQSNKGRIEFPVTFFNGVNNSDDAASINDNNSPDTLNTVLDSVGSIQSRKGYTKLLSNSSALGAPIQGMHPYYNNSIALKQIVYGSGTHLYRYDNAGGSVQIGGPYTANAQWDFDTYNDTMYAVNGNDGIFSYNGGAVTLITNSLLPYTAKIHKNRLWVVQPNSSTVYFSEAGDPTTFPAGNFINVNTNDGQVVTGTMPLLDSLIVFKTDSIWVITGEPEGAGNSTIFGNLFLRRANSEVGCVAWRTICKVESVLFFMARSGIFIFQNYQSQLLSSPVNGTFRTDMNLNFQSNAWAIYSYYEKKYILGYSSSASTTPDKAIMYDTLIKRFSIWDDVPGSCAVTFRFNQTDVCLVGDPNKGLIYQYFNGYADISGDNGTVSSATSTTLTDTTKAWTTNQFVDAKVTIVSGTGVGQVRTISANTATQLTVPAWAIQPDTSSLYSIGAYNHYWKSKIFDMSMPAMTKRFKYLKIFTDSANNYSIQAGVSIDFQPLTFNLPAQSLGSGTITWGQAGITWGASGVTWGTKSELFKRVGLPGQGRYIQIMFGNNTANQPWRAFEYTITYKNKKERAQ